MAAFVAKHVLGNKIEAVKGQLLSDDQEKEELSPEDEAKMKDIEDARQLEELKRKEKHRKAEAEREKMRESIRAKYGLDKSASNNPESSQREGGSNTEDITIGDFNLSQIGDKISDIPNDIKQKCCIS